MVPPRSSITFRPHNESDLPFLRHLYGTTREHEMQLVQWTPAEKSAFLDMQFTAQKTHYEQYYPGCAFLVIEVEGTAIGRLYIDRSRDEIRLIEIALLPEYRRRGIGGLLIGEILDEGASTNKTVTIYVEHDNPARRLYDRLGFRHIDTNGIYHCMEWRGASR